MQVRSGSTINISGCAFIGNEADFGCAISVYSSDIFLNGSPTNLFMYNSKSSISIRGALGCRECTLTMAGNNTFERNGFLATDKGGAVAIFNGKLVFEGGISTFKYNRAAVMEGQSCC